VLRGAAAVAVAIGSLASTPGAAGAAGSWLPGDLHVHTTYSHDSYGPPAELLPPSPTDVYTLGWTVREQFALGASRGLQYMAITDHNDIRSQTDPGFGFGGLIALPAYENSLKGHAQMLGARHLYPNGDKGTAAVRRLEAALHGSPDRGVFQANHPNDPKWEYAYDVPVDTVEAWNLPWYYQPPFPAASDNDRALRYWEGWLDRGRKVGVTGGSDNHYRATAPAQGVGQPTTWVFARERSVRGVLGGVRAGHTFVSHEPPAYGGPTAFLEADGNGDGRYEAMVGDTVPPGSALRVRVMGATGALLRVVSDGGRQAFAPVPISSGSFEYRFRLPRKDSWVHAEVYGTDVADQRVEGCTGVVGADGSKATTYCTNRVLMLALTSAIYLRATVAHGSARLAALPRGCVRRPFRATVTGRRIARVMFSLDGGRARAGRRVRRGSRYDLRLDPRRPGAHRLAARVWFERGSATPPRTLSRRFAVCARRERGDVD
jgi:hypothetical protein